MLLPDRLPSLVLLVGSWVPPAALGWAAAALAHRRPTRFRPALLYSVLTILVLGWSAAWFLINRSAMPPYIPGSSEDPTYAPPKAVAGLLIVATALVLPVSAIACALAFRIRGRSVRGSSGTHASA
jgi:hypothetical protein